MAAGDTCRIEGCENVCRKGMVCGKCRSRKERHGTYHPPYSEIHCAVCGMEVPWCGRVRVVCDDKGCRAEYARRRTAEWREAPGNMARHKKNAASWDRRQPPGSRSAKRHNLDWDVFISEHERLDGRCNICGRPPTGRRKVLDIDHDHTCCPGATSCGECVRGLICGSCNALLGLAGDDVAILRAAIRYLAGIRTPELVNVS